MPLSATDRAELDRLGVENVRQRVAYCGPGTGATIPGLGTGVGMMRGDVEEWLADKERKGAKLQHDILWWAKAAALIGIIGIVVAIAIAILPYLLSEPAP
jgi:hypothetical protein